MVGTGNLKVTGRLSRRTRQKSARELVEYWMEPVTTDTEETETSGGGYFSRVKRKRDGSPVTDSGPRTGILYFDPRTDAP